MKKLFVIALVMSMLLGCAKNQRYLMPPPKTQTDFLADREDCSNLSGFKEGGFFMFGPAIIVFPVIIIIEAVQVKRQKVFQKCMTEREYQCDTGCWNIKTKQKQTISKNPQSGDDRV